MQGNIRIVLTLSILKNKNTVTTDWIEIKLIKFNNAYLCFIEFEVGNWSEKKKTSLLCFVLFANMSLVLVQFPIPVYQPQSVTAKLLIIHGHIKMRYDVL